MKAACGPPYQSGTPKRCEDPTATSAPHSPGGFSSVSANRSAATVTSAPLACASAVSRLEIADGPRAPRILLHDAEVVAGGRTRTQVDDVEREPQGPQTGRQHGDGLREAVRIDDHPVRLAGGATAHQRDGLGHRGALVEQRGVRRVEPGEIGHHGLEVEEGLQPTLADLGLVGGVRRVPGRALEDVAPDDARRDGPGVAEADHGLGDGVLGGQAAELLQHLMLGDGRREVERAEAAHTARHRGVDQCVERLVAEDLEHLLLLLGRGADVAPHEVLERLEYLGSACRRAGRSRGSPHVFRAQARHWSDVLPALSLDLRASP